MSLKNPSQNFLAPYVETVSLIFRMRRKFTPSQTIPIEIAEVVEVLAQRVSLRGCDLVNLNAYLKRLCIKECLKVSRGSVVKARTLLNMSPSTWHYYNSRSSFGRLDSRLISGR